MTSLCRSPIFSPPLVVVRYVHLDKLELHFPESPCLHTPTPHPQLVLGTGDLGGEIKQDPLCSEDHGCSRQRVTDKKVFSLPWSFLIYAQLPN